MSADGRVLAYIANGGQENSVYVRLLDRDGPTLSFPAPKVRPNWRSPPTASGLPLRQTTRSRGVANFRCPAGDARQRHGHSRPIDHSGCPTTPSSWDSSERDVRDSRRWRRHGHVDDATYVAWWLYYHFPRPLPGGKALLFTRHRKAKGEVFDVAVLHVDTGAYVWCWQTRLMLGTSPSASPRLRSRRLAVRRPVRF